MIDSSLNTIHHITRRGVEDCIVREELESRMASGEVLRVKLGIDPTSPDLHLGHMMPLRKLAQFQRAGHQACLVVGTFTAKIGDPTGKNVTRPPLTDEEIGQNLLSYLEQASVILNIERTEISYNGDWLRDLNFESILRLAGAFTVQQMLQRDMFAKRMQEEREINMVEFFYPLMQGYDSVALRSDVEIGGTDQLFNNMAGRKIQQHYGQPPQHILTVPLLVGLDGSQKMSKSLGNHIALADSPRDVYGKSMKISDEMMEAYYLLLTDLSEEQIADTLSGHPRDAKMKLAHAITTLLKGSEEADRAQKEFVKIYSGGGQEGVIPTDALVLSVKIGEASLLDLIMEAQFSPSRSQARRLIEQGGVRLNQEVVSDIHHTLTIEPRAEQILQVGKKHFARVQGV